MDENEIELLNMSFEEMNRIANGDENEEPSEDTDL